MPTQKAVVLQGDGKVALVQDRSSPRIRPGYVLVDVRAVALNPADWKHVDFLNVPGILCGCDYAGVVADLGQGYDKPWKRGDRICGFVLGANKLEKEDGTFAERIVAKADIQMKIPDSMTFENAATLGVAFITCGQGLYQSLGLSLPNQPIKSKEPILIYGGSSAMGTFGIQFAKLSGYTVLATSSPRNFDLLKSMGADAVFDYRDSDCAAKIRQRANDNLKLVWDCISEKSSAKICTDALASGGVYGTILQVDSPRDDIQVKYTLGYTCVGEPVDKGFFKQDDTTADFEFMKKFIPIAESLLHQGKLKPHPVRLGNGLENVIDGMDMLRQGKVSGEKLVYKL
ncbi:hypothetical protein CLAIMM_03054 [Cladophialophora immunda]|nr:hypothetical protein CLAIMM_03054 [Cladophialophora immunda]